MQLIGQDFAQTTFWIFMKFLSFRLHAIDLISNELFISTKLVYCQDELRVSFVIFAVKLFAFNLNHLFLVKLLEHNRISRVLRKRKNSEFKICIFRLECLITRLIDDLFTALDEVVYWVMQFQSDCQLESW